MYQFSKNTLNFQPQLMTVIPRDLRWCIKLLDPDGCVFLLGDFDSRFLALGFATLLGASLGIRVLP